MGDDAKRLVLMGLLTLWAVAWGMSVYGLATISPSGDGFLRGVNRMTAFLGWQMAAALPAFGAWAVGRDWPKESGVRLVSRVPLQLAAGLAAVVGGLMLWAILAGRP
jgi:hypothetical protein